MINCTIHRKPQYLILGATQDMMVKRIAVIGAGPSGVAAAKSVESIM